MCPTTEQGEQFVTPTTPVRWKLVAHVLAYNFFVFGIILITSFTPIGFFALPLVLLLWFSISAGSPIKPNLPKRPVSSAARWLWFGGALIFAMGMLGCAHLAGVHDAMDKFTACTFGLFSWAFLYLTIYDYRRIPHTSTPAVLAEQTPGSRG